MYRRSQKMQRRVSRIRNRSDAVESGAEWRPRFKHDDLADFEHRLHGDAVVPGDPDYDSARQVFYRQFQRYPEIIVYCESAGDVRNCLAFAGQYRIEVICRSSGHSSAGFSINDGMVIDLSRMNSVYVDAKNRLAVVESGACFHKLNAALSDEGLHVPGGGCDEVCVGGYMQGGGYGFTSREFGMNCDNVAEVKVLLWNGRTVTANGDTNVDLYWAIRGGMGGNFGVLLSITYRLHSIGPMWGFGLSWGAADAPAVLAKLQSEYMKGSDVEKLGYQCALMIADQEPRLYMRGLYHGSKDEGRNAVRPLKKMPGATPDIELCGSYVDLNRTLLEKPVPIPTAPDDVLEEKQSGYVADFIDIEHWKAVVEFMATSPNPWNDIGIEPYGGAISRSDDGNSFIHRDVYMNLFLEVFWFRPEERGRVVAWLDKFMAMMAPHMNGEAYQNYPRPGVPDAQKSYWADYYGTLQTVKAKYDPDEWFGNAQSITLPGTTPPGADPPKGPKFPDRPIQYDD